MNDAAYDPLDPRRDRDPREPVDHPVVDEPVNDPGESPLEEPPVGDPPDAPAEDEPVRRDPDPKEPARRLLSYRRFPSVTRPP
jgi:hypothetical protein